MGAQESTGERVDGPARAAEARGDWRAAAQLWQDCRTRFPRHPAHRRWGIELARALTRLSEWQQAYETWTILAESAPLVAASAVSRARCYLEWQGPTEEAARLAAAVLEQHPQEIRALRLCAHLTRARGDDPAALALARRWVGLEPDSVDAHASFMDAARRTAELAGAREVFEAAPRALRDSPEYQARALLPYFQLQADFVAGLRVIDGLKPDALDQHAALAVAAFLDAAARTERLLEFTAAMLARFPDSVQLKQRYLSAVHNACGAGRFELEKERLCSGLTPEQVTQLLLSLPAIWLSTVEAAMVARSLTAHSSVGWRDHRLFAVACRTEPEVLDPLVVQLESQGTLADRLAARLLSSAMRDRRRLSGAGLAVCDWGEFAAEARLLGEEVAALTESAAATGLMSPQGIEAIRTVGQLASRCREAWLHTRETYWSAASFACWLIERIRRREPTAFVRLGDGEGNFLPYPAAAREFQEIDRRSIQRTWWGAERITSPELVTQPLAAAVSQADALGIPEPWLLLRDSPRLAPTAYGRGEAAILQFLRAFPAAALASKVLVASKVHQDLEGWGLYRQVFAALNSVSVISCHDLARPLAERFGVGVRQWYRVAPEYRYAGMFTAAQTSLSEPYFPDAFLRIMESVDPLPGEVFLVAAGFLGKILCGRIRDRGGIALDVGAMADVWSGYQTRVESIRELDFDPVTSLIAGQPFTDAFDAASIDLTEPCRTDRVRRHNLTGRFAQVFGEERRTPREGPYALRVIGHPRCGSTYVARSLRRYGLEIGHERPSEHGLCSWIHAVHDLNPPFRAVPIPAQAFRVTLAYVRDPAAAIPSIMLENCDSASFAFRRFHIARRLGADLARRRDPLERAVESLLSWMQIVAAERPLFTLRVERLAQDWEAHAPLLTAVGLSYEEGRGAEPQIARDINAAAHKFPLPKPRIDPAAYRSLPPDLSERLAAFCASHGYPFPGGR